MEYPKDKDFTQVIKAGFDEDTQRHKVEALISDGVDALLVNPDGSLNVKITANTAPPDPSVSSYTVESGTVATAYNEVSSVPSGTLTTIVSYTCTGPTRIKFAEVTGTNIAEYTVLVNGIVKNKKRTYYGNLDNSFQFAKGLGISSGDVISLQVTHNQTDLGDFSGFILVMQDEEPV